MKFRLLGKITNADAAAHTPLVEVQGCNYGGGSMSPQLPTRYHFNPLRKRDDVVPEDAALREDPMLEAQKSVTVDEVFEMDAVESVRIFPEFSYGMVFSYEVQVVEE